MCRSPVGSRRTGSCRQRARPRCCARCRRTASVPGDFRRRATSTTSTTLPGPVVKLDPITLNMADGHFLRVGLGFQMESKFVPPAKPDTTDATGEYAKALDLAIKDLGGRSYGELVTVAGRDA